MTAASAAPARREHLTALTSLRFFAAFWVLIYHALSEAKGLPAFASGLVKNGFVGVSLFFILSGFVLTYTYRGTSATLGEFFLARFARIYPVYLFSMLLAAPLFFKGFIAAGHADQVGSLVAGKLTLIQSWIPWMKHSWNEPSWSLSTEAFFYLLFPLLLPLLASLPTRFRWTITGLCILAYGFGLPMAQAFGPDISLSALRDLPLFAAGILVGLQFIEGWRAPRWLLPVSLVAVLAMVGLYDPIPSNGWVKAGFTLGLAGVIGGVASIAPSARTLLNHPWLKRLGEASYALYIVHVPIAGIFGYAIAKVGLTLTNPIALVGYIAVCIWTSLVIFNIIETPANRYLRRLGPTRKTVSAAA